MDICGRVLNEVHRLRRRLIDITSHNGVVSFSFDDFPASALHEGATILEDAGWRGTYYTCGGLLGTTTKSGPIATFEEVQECHERGHEIANHTLRHLDCTQAASARVRTEIDENKKILKSATRNFAFPFGEGNIREQRLVKKLVTTARGVRHGINGRGTDRLDLLANPIYSSAGTDGLFRQIETATESGGWLIFYTHDVAANPSSFGCTPAALRAVVAAVQDAGLPVLTIEQARLNFGLHAA